MKILDTAPGKDGAIGLFGIAAATGSHWIAQLEPWLALGSHIFGFVAAGLSAALLALRLWRAIKKRGDDK